MHTNGTQSTMILQHLLFLFTLTILPIVQGKIELIEHLVNIYTHFTSQTRPPHGTRPRGATHLEVSLKGTSSYYFNIGSQREGNYAKVKLLLVQLVAW